MRVLFSFVFLFVNFLFIYFFISSLLHTRVYPHWSSCFCLYSLRLFSFSYIIFVIVLQLIMPWLGWVLCIIRESKREIKRKNFSVCIHFRLFVEDTICLMCASIPFSRLLKPQFLRLTLLRFQSVHYYEHKHYFGIDAITCNTIQTIVADSFTRSQFTAPPPPPPFSVHVLRMCKIFKTLWYNY